MASNSSGSGQQFRSPNMNNPQQTAQNLPNRPVQTLERQEITTQATFKQDIAKARELLTELLNKSAAILQENTKQPGSQQDSQRLRLEKRLEDLYTVLDQMEINLKLAIQWHNQSLDSRKHCPIPIAGKKTDELAASKTVQLPQYMKVAKWQIQSAKELHDLITDTENKLAQASVPPTPVSLVSTMPLTTPTNIPPTGR